MRIMVALPWQQDGSNELVLTEFPPKSNGTPPPPAIKVQPPPLVTGKGARVDLKLTPRPLTLYRHRHLLHGHEPVWLYMKLDGRER